MYIGTGGSNKRNLILNAALKKFSEKTFQSATTAEIADEAGVSEKTIFDIFGDKKSLYLELRQAIREAVFRELLISLPLGRGAPGLLRALGRQFLHVVRENIDVARVIMQAVASLDDPEIRQSTQHNYTRIQLLIKGIVEQGQQAGLVRENIDLENFAWTYCMALFAMSYMLILEYPPPGAEKTALLLIDRLVDMSET